ncbi:MAG: GntR family transcriptional regulator [Beijerinckiaceae bacterium]|nr:GntR family transcriptional regulator [Beijerinckiaceae bacterium]
MTRDHDPDRSVSQTVKALLSLRDLILSGALRPGERISELSMVERTGVSRTPVRMALVRLEEEGLIEAIPSGGFAVKAFTEADIFDAIEVRGAMEGLVARAAAERGVSRSSLAAIRDCLAEIDELIGSVDLTLDHFSDYVRLNARFHALLHELSGSPVMIRQAERAGALPFASPSGFVIAQSALPQARTILIVAQDQHRCVVEAIETREGERADAIMREHARLARRNLQLALENQSTLDLVAGSSLIRRGGRG